MIVDKKLTIVRLKADYYILFGRFLVIRPNYWWLKADRYLLIGLIGLFLVNRPIFSYYSADYYVLFGRSLVIRPFFIFYSADYSINT